MPATINYTCDHTGKACNDADILADATGATQRVLLDATIYSLDASDPENPKVKTTSMGQHVFASIADAVAWAEGISLT